MTEILRVDNFDDRYLITATRKGFVKKTVLAAYSRPKKGGIKAMVLEEDDELIGVNLLTDHQGVILATASGLAIHFDEADARPMGRVARGVRGIKLKPGDEVVSLLGIQDERRRAHDLRERLRQAYGDRRIPPPVTRRPGTDQHSHERPQRPGRLLPCRPRGRIRSCSSRRAG